MNETKHIGTLIPYELWKAFSVKCKVKETKQAEVLREAVQKFVNEGEN